MTTWVLVISLFSYDRGAISHTIQNMKSLDECNRVAQVLEETYKRVGIKRCIEVHIK